MIASGISPDMQYLVIFFTGGFPTNRWNITSAWLSVPFLPSPFFLAVLYIQEKQQTWPVFRWDRVQRRSRSDAVSSGNCAPWNPSRVRGSVASWKPCAPCAVSAVAMLTSRRLIADGKRPTYRSQPGNDLQRYDPTNNHHIYRAVCDNQRVIT